MTIRPLSDTMALEICANRISIRRQAESLTLSDTMALEFAAGRPRKIDIPDTEANYWLGESKPRAGINHDVTQDIATVSDDRMSAARGVATAIAATMGGLSILLAGMVIGHLLLLPDATIWPMACASLLTGVGSVAVLAGVLRS